MNASETTTLDAALHPGAITARAPTAPMRFGLIVEACVPHGVTFHQRYKEMIDEAVYAEEMGFDFWGSSEHHFLVDIGISSPEVFFAAVARHTKRIKLRHMVRLMLTMNHPLRIAEQAATLDLVSDGRVELGLGRSNQEIQLDAFQIDPETTKEQLLEGVDLIVKAFNNDSFVHEGKFWNIPKPAHLTPRPLQNPHPPLFLGATSEEMHGKAGDWGFGILSWDNYRGWEQARAHADLYKSRIANPSALKSTVVNDNMSFLVIPAYCCESAKEAKQRGGPIALEFVNLIIKVFPSMARRAKSYDYMRWFEQLEPYKDDIDYFLETTPGMLVGTPDYFVSQIRRLQELGYDEVILRIDGAMKHEELMRAIKLIGQYVIPEFKSPRNIVRSGIFPSGGIP